VVKTTSANVCVLHFLVLESGIKIIGQFVSDLGDMYKIVTVARRLCLEHMFGMKGGNL
jgi:hypothetical protein